MSNLFTKQNKNILSDIPFTQAEDWFSLDDTRVINEDSGFSDLWRGSLFLGLMNLTRQRTSSLMRLATASTSDHWDTSHL